MKKIKSKQSRNVKGEYVEAHIVTTTWKNPTEEDPNAEASVTCLMSTKELKAYKKENKAK